MSGAAAVLSTARRRLVVDSLGIWAIAIIVGGIFGFTARQGGLSLIEAIAFIGGAKDTGFNSIGNQ
jgi:hypothetical protein